MICSAKPRPPGKTKSPTAHNVLSGFKLPLLGSNQDSPDPESGVLPVTPRGKNLRFRRSTGTLIIVRQPSSINPARLATPSRRSQRDGPLTPSTSFACTTRDSSSQRVSDQL